MKPLKIFTTFGLSTTFAISSFVGLPKETVAQEADNRPYAVFVNGYQNCCAWDMKDVTNELESQGAEIRYTPWNNFNDRGKDTALGNDAAFLREAADYINNQLDPNRPLILIGHSFGGDSLLSLAPRINRRILFLGVIDPVAAGGFRAPIRGRGVPSNVDYFFNRWETNRLHYRNVVPFDSAINGTVNECRGKVCDQKEENLARNADGSEIRVDCRWDEVTCPGFVAPIPFVRSGRKGKKAQRLFHNPMPYDAYIQRQIVGRIKPLLASYQPDNTPPTTNDSAPNSQAIEQAKQQCRRPREHSNIFQNNTGPILVENATSNPISVSLYDASGNKQSEVTQISPQVPSWIPNNNNKLQANGDWAFQVGDGCLHYIGEEADFSERGSYFFLQYSGKENPTPRPTSQDPACRRPREHNNRFTTYHTGPILVVNKTSSPISVSLYDASGNKQSEVTQVRSQIPSWIPNNNNKLKANGDWAIQVGDGCLHYIGEEAQFSERGSYFYLQYTGDQ